jgi:putative ABC transport system permease protein
MFKNYFKIAFRNIKNYKGYSFINILGLAVGMACCMLLLLWVQDEMSFDKFHEKAENIYRVELDLPRSTGTVHTRLTSYPLGGAIQENIPEVKYAARVTSISHRFCKSPKNRGDLNNFKKIYSCKDKISPFSQTKKIGSNFY